MARSLRRDGCIVEELLRGHSKNNEPSQILSHLAATYDRKQESLMALGEREQLGQW